MRVTPDEGVSAILGCRGRVGDGAHAFSPTFYRQRNRVERFCNRLKHCRRIVTRNEKLAANYLAMIKLAAIRIWLRAYESTT